MKPPNRLFLSISLLAFLLTVPQLLPRGEAVPMRKSFDRFPHRVGNWETREGSVLDQGALDILKPHDYMMRRDQDGAGQNVWLFVAYWDTQRKGAQPHSPRNCLPGAGWEPLEASRLTIPLPVPFGAITANRYVIQKDRNQQLVFYWYHSQGKAIAGEMAARFAMVRSSILRRRTDGALVRVSSPVRDSVSETSERLTQYIQALYPILGEFLPE